MANNRQYRSRTLFVGTRGVKEYRASIPHWVNGSDTVLEIGCEWGTTTTIIAEHAAAVIGTDVSPTRSTSTCRGYPDTGRCWT